MLDNSNFSGIMDARYHLKNGKCPAKIFWQGENINLKSVKEADINH